MKFLTLSLLLFVLFFAACKKADEITNNAYNTTNNTTVAPPAKADLIPLKMGNTWTWRYIVFNGGTSDTTTSSEYVDSYTSIDDGLWSNISDGVVYQTEANLNNGFYDHYPNGPHMNYKYPASKDDRVVMDGIFSGTDTLDVTSVNESVTVPAGTFTCYVYYLHTGSNTTSYTHVAPGVGIVKKELYTNGTLHLEQELMSYTLH